MVGSGVGDEREDILDAEECSLSNFHVWILREDLSLTIFCRVSTTAGTVGQLIHREWFVVVEGSS